KDGGLRLCVDYRKLNAVTRKNKHPVPPMNQLLNVFNGSSIFSKIDLRGAYNLLRIKEGAEHLTAFRAKYGSYEYLVMPFGLTNAPASFQNIVNDILQDLLDFYVVAYLDDIMVFSKSEEKHFTHVSTVLSRSRANSLFAKASKCLFHVSSVEYLGYVVSSEDLKMDQAKVQQILNWPPPRNLKALQYFLGFANFYCRFIKNYSKKIRKHPIAFSSCKVITAELNYEIHDKELLGIVWDLKCWRAFLLSLSSPFEVLTNHSSLQYFRSSKVLTRPQARWAEFISEFHLSITCHPGHLATLTDALSRWDNVYLERGEDFISKNPMNFQQIIKQDEVQPSRYFAVKVESFLNLIESIQKKLWQDSQYRSILQDLVQDTPAGKLATKIQSVQQDFKRELEVSINRFKRYANKSRANPPVFNPGNMVWLSSKNIKSTRPTKKLSERWLGPFPVLKKVSIHAYHLKLPSQWKSIHPVFHISLLEPVKTSTIPNWHQEPPPPIIIEEEEEWEVSQILDSKLKRRKLCYLVEWKGFSQDQERSTWEPSKNLKNCLAIVKDFHSLYPDKPGPNSSRG
ncbi:hypothetical protein O181_062348, partial [Austropuccinia psidii MF-1]|nr:hypothetical protein [Austropuccinia psidii MF-1]